MDSSNPRSDADLATAHADDLDLARRVVAGDREAFETLFETGFGRLFRFCSARVRDEAACEDIVQETLIKAVRHLHTYRGEASLFTWLCQICRNEVSNWFRRHGQVESDGLLVSIDDDPSVRAALESLASADETDRLATIRLVQLALDYLPDRYARALEWKYIEGLSVEEIAGRLETGEIAVQSLLARARKAFRGAIVDLESGLSNANAGWPDEVTR